MLDRLATAQIETEVAVIVLLLEDAEEFIPVDCPLPDRQMIGVARVIIGKMNVGISTVELEQGQGDVLSLSGEVGGVEALRP